MMPRTFSSRWKNAGSIAALCLLAAAACSDSSGPEAESAAGSYQTTSLTTVTNGVTTNELALGNAVTIVLHPGGTTTGTLHLIATQGFPAEDVSLAGTWSQSGSTVTFDHAEDTFVNDMPFVLVGNTLRGDATFLGTRVLITLTRI